MIPPGGGGLRGPIPVGIGYPVMRALDAHAGRVRSDRDPAEDPLGFGGGQRGPARNVRANAVAPGQEAPARTGLGCGLEWVLPNVREHHAQSLADPSFRATPPDAARAARDERRTSCP